MEGESMDLRTTLIHSGLERTDAAVVQPIFQSATYKATEGGSYDDIRYLRLNNSPNHRDLAVRLTAITGGEAAVVTSSGMAAITTTLMALVQSGEHILAQDCLYGGSLSFLAEDAPAMGIAVDTVDGDAPDSWAAKVRDNTRVFLVESLSNPTLRVADLAAIVSFCRERGILSVIDNTFASPVNYRPLEAGFDVEVHSATKYLNGHSDLVAGCVISTAAIIDRVTHKLNHLGGTLDPHACFLLQRGMKTLALRVAQQNENAAYLAQRLADHPAVAHVNYPSLNDHPHRVRAERLFAGFGGVLSFDVVGGGAEAQGVMDRLGLAVDAPSLGGVETLVSRPAVSSHAGQAPEQRLALGISDGLIRVAVGIEAAEDLWADFGAALAGVRK
ncbi:MAG TPA: cystathionine beta-lyase [Candidatus Latescibacteria bacterium]|nr:cystathionine beta-lyase [Candidatus Latescibacterota bacterium]|tara:strand:- start:148 stop:1308 length:1161 start_codon:yes stop_codon:yes gene_type:complete